MSHSPTKKGVLVYTALQCLKNLLEKLQDHCILPDLQRSTRVHHPEYLHVCGASHRELKNWSAPRDRSASRHRQGFVVDSESLEKETGPCLYPWVPVRFSALSVELYRRRTVPSAAGFKSIRGVILRTILLTMERHV